jgi:hypothetical protein
MKSGFLVILIFISSCAIFAQDPLPLPDKPGTWSYEYLNDGNTKMYCDQFAMSAGDIALFKTKLDKIASVLHQNPIMADPKGFDPAVQSRPYYPSGFKNQPENFGYIGEINFRLVPWFNSKGKDYRQTIEPPRVTLYFNNIHILRHSAFNVAGPDGEDIKKAENRANDVCRAMKIKEFAPGVILYDYAIVISSPDRQLFLPCTVAEAYKRLMNYYALAAKKEPAFGVILTGIKQEYSTLTAAQLNMPAYFGGMFSGITPEKNDDPLYIFNSDFFDRSRPKTDVQTIVFPIDADYFRKESDFAANSVGFKRINQFLHSLDFSTLAGLID